MANLSTAFIFSLLAGGVFLLLSTANSSSLSEREIRKQLSNPVPSILCNKGKSPFQEDLFHTQIVPFIAPIVPAVLTAGVIILVANLVLRNPGGFQKFRDVVIYSVGVSLIVFASISFLRTSADANVKDICLFISQNFKSMAESNARDVIKPFLDLHQYLPSKLPLDYEDPRYQIILQIHAVLFPHISSYLSLISPYLFSSYVFLAVALLIRPLRNFVEGNQLVLSSLASVALLVVQQMHKTSDPFANPSNILEELLGVAILFSITVTIISIIMFAFRVISRKLIMLSILLLVTRVHALGIPHLDLHLEILLVVFVIVSTLCLCESSAGAVLLYTLYAHHYRVPLSIEWVLFVTLVDNAILSGVGALLAKAHKQKRE